jgi:ABC-2 type transport system permease protein
MGAFFRDLRLLFVMHVRRTLRAPIWLIVGLFQPICYILLFGPLLKSLTNVPGFPPGGAYNVFTPGLLILTVLFGSAFAGFNVLEDLRAGVVERLRVTPVSRLALLLSYVLRDALTLLLQAAILIGVALPLGLTPDTGGLALTFGLVLLIGLTMSACSYALALALKDEGALASTVNLFVLPLMLLSGIMLPLSFAPELLRNLAKGNPFAYATDAARALIEGHVGDVVVPQAFVIFAVLTALALLWATRAIRQATA